LLKRSDTPLLLKHQLLVEISKEIREIRSKLDFAIRLDELVKSQAAKLWAIVKPLMHQQTVRDWEDLNLLMYQAYSVASDMASAPYEWRFDFAPIGSPYDTSMINKDPFLRGPDEDVARQNVVVKLGYSPAVFLRDSKDGVVMIAQLTRHQVLVKSQ
jgi:hypothetical protein